MASAEIESGICSFCTTVHTEMETAAPCSFVFEHHFRLRTEAGRAAHRGQPYREISYRGEGRPTLASSRPNTWCTRPAPSPSGILKAIEVEASLALPKDASIKPRKE